MDPRRAFESRRRAWVRCEVEERATAMVRPMKIRKFRWACDGGIESIGGAPRSAHVRDVVIAHGSGPAHEKAREEAKAMTTCLVPTHEEAAFAAILSRIEGEMSDTIMKAIVRAFERATLELGVMSSEDRPPPPRDYFVSVAHQGLFCELCGADKTTLENGDASVAGAIVDNYQGLREIWALAAS